MKPVAICDNLLTRVRTGEIVTPKLKKWLEENDIPYEMIDCYESDIISKLDNYSALLWHYGNFVNADLMEAQNILDIAAKKGLKVFPDHATGWYTDDKVAESYAFQMVGAPTPRNWVFYEYDTCCRWLETEAKYPIVAKLRRGAGSNNVKLLSDLGQAKKYAKKMFTKGMSPAQSLLYKTYSKVQSTRDWKTFVKRFKLIPNFLKARQFGKGLPVERGYVYLQEFIPNEGFDIKVVVVNDKLGFLVRKTRKGDFRASGSGDIIYDRSFITKQIIDSAFFTADSLNLQQVGFDYVVDKRTGNGLIIEMCYGFDVEAIYGCGGWYSRDGIWHDGPLDVPVELMESMGFMDTV